MRGVYLEKFSLPRALKQGYELASFVPEETWLADIFPGTLERYRDVPHAIKNVGRVAIDRGMEGFIVRGGRRQEALGIATIVFNQTLLLPKGAKLQANNVDYWLRSKASWDQSLHCAVGDELVTASAEAAGGAHYAFTTTPIGHEHNYGLHYTLPQHDGITFMPGEDGDPYGVAWDNETAEFHGREIRASRIEKN